MPVDAIEIPNLSQSYISRLYCAIYVQSPEQELVDWIKFIGERHVADAGNGLWLRDLYFSPEENGRHALAIAILTIEKSKPDASLGEVTDRGVIDERLSHFAGKKAYVRMMIEAQVPRDLVPKKGKVDALLGVGTDSGGIQIELTGAKMRVRGSVFDAFRWELSDQQDASGSTMAVVESELEGWLLNEVVTPSILARVASFGSKAIDYFLLDKAAAEAIMSPKREA